jgi:O-antigen ligase
MISNVKANFIKLNTFSDKAAFFCVVAFMIFIPVSTALMNLFIFLTFLFVLFSGNLKNNLILIWSNSVSRAALLLFFLLIASLNWTIDSSEAVDVLKKYNELWYIAIMLPIFNSESRRQIGINAFLVSMAIILFGVYLLFFEIILPIEWTLKGRNHHFNLDGGFASHILTNILMAFTMFISAHKLIISKMVFKLPYLILTIFSFYYVLFISNGTSGQILALSLILLFFIQQTGVRSILFIPAILAVITVLTFSNESNSMRNAIDKLAVRYHHLTTTDTAGNNTRPQIYITALKLIRDEPWIGTGVGSFEEALRSKQPEFYAATTIAKQNPHNEYLMISVQLGLAGILMLMYLFYTQASSSEKISIKEYKFLAQGLVVLIVIGCAGNSMILDSREGHFWAYFSALLFSTMLVKNSELDDYRSE